MRNPQAENDLIKTEGVKYTSHSTYSPHHFKMITVSFSGVN